MIIDRQQYFVTVSADENKLIVDVEKNIFKVVYLPLALTDQEIEARYSEVDVTDFEITIPYGKYTKLQIRRACRALGIESKLNDLLSSDAIFAADWSDAQEIDLQDEILKQALMQGNFTQTDIQQIKDVISNG